MVTVHSAAQWVLGVPDLLLMDADVLYDERVARALVAGAAPVNRLLIDREFEAGDEPVKVWLRAGTPVEFRKQIPAGLQFETIGESVGFFRFDSHGARRLAALVAGYVARGHGHLPHDVRRAAQEILPQLQPLADNR